MMQLKQILTRTGSVRFSVSTKYTPSVQGSCTARLYSDSARQRTTFNRNTNNKSNSSARAPRSTAAQNVITFLAASSLGIGAYLYQWNQHHEGSFLNPFSASEELTTEKWTPILLKTITKVSNETSLFEFQLPKPCTIPVSSAIYVKDDEIQAMRAYTPLHSTEKEQDTFQLLIKRYSEGQVSRFMHSARPGTKIEMRGPILIWPGGRSDLEQWDEIGMIAGGTGITAFMPIIHSALTHPTKKIKISLLFASQSPEELYFKDELEQLSKSFPDQLRVSYTVDRVLYSDPAASQETKWDGYVGYVNETMLRGLLPVPKSITAGVAAAPSATEEDSAVKDPETRKSVVLVCGPEPMVQHVTGPRGLNGQEPIRGVLGAMGYQKDQVFRFPN
ncbi:NADH-cytochrome b5 reductase [Mortierella sp. GBA30]|nr:NADH-cytochrome b5 reductase [Mortierella sp. GBA30]